MKKELTNSSTNGAKMYQDIIENHSTLKMPVIRNIICSALQIALCLVDAFIIRLYN